MAENKSLLEYISDCQDLVDMNDFMDDEGFEEALGLAVKCIAKPDLPPANAREAVVKMQSYAFKFRVQALNYNYLDTGPVSTPQGKKKNVYYAMSEQCHEMAQTLKYLLKEKL